MSEDKTNAPEQLPDEREPTGAPEVSKILRKQRARNAQSTIRAPLYDAVEIADAKLGLDPTALRARLRRAQRVEGNAIVADLGGGIQGFKFGKSWRIRFPEA